MGEKLYSLFSQRYTAKRPVLASTQLQDKGLRIPNNMRIGIESEQDELWQEARYFLEVKDERALRRGSHVRDRRDGQLGAAGSGGQEDDRIGPRAYGQDRGGIGYQPCSRFQDAGPTRFGSGSTPTLSTLPLTIPSGL